jgi:hypothetical protein
MEAEKHEPISPQEAIRRLLAAGVQFRCASPLDVDVPGHGWLPIGSAHVLVFVEQVIGHALHPDLWWDVFRALADLDAFVATRELFDERGGWR